jgi:hypothetical protein
MALLEEAINTRAAAVSALTDLIAARFYPDRMPEDVVLPAVTYTRLSGPRAHAMGSDPGITEPVFHMIAWADTKSEALAVAAALRTAFQDWSGTVDGVVIERSFLNDEDGYYNADAEAYRQTVTFTIAHLE